MHEPQMPPQDHEQFDAICRTVEDFEPLPTVVTPADERQFGGSAEEEPTPLDGLILAGLVSP